MPSSEIRVSTAVPTGLTPPSGSIVTPATTGWEASFSL